MNKNAPQKILLLLWSLETTTIANAIPLYSITDLGHNLGFINFPSAINEQGEVVGYIDPTIGLNKAILYKKDKTIDLSIPNGYSYANDINDNGQIAISWADELTNTSRSFLYDNGSMTELGTLGGDTSWATAINNQGQIVGESRTQEGLIRAFLYSNGNLTNLGTLGGIGGGEGVGYSLSAASDINDQSQIIGYSFATNGYPHAFLWERGIITDIGTLGGNYSMAEAINNSGQIVGTSETADGLFLAFIYSGNNMVDIGEFDPMSINDLGQVVGVKTIESQHQRGVLYDNGELVDLNALIPQDSGWTILWATDINNLGQISAHGYKEGVGFHALFLNPKTYADVTEPGAMGLISSGIIILLQAGRRRKKCNSKEHINMAVRMKIMGSPHRAQQPRTSTGHPCC